MADWIDLEPGGPAWWHEAPIWHPRGIIPTILRLLEQQEITRMKATELLRYWYMESHEAHLRPTEVPPAPWNNLNWAEPPEPVKRDYSLGPEGDSFVDHGYDARAEAETKAREP
jgi:hypothetical protein